MIGCFHRLQWGHGVEAVETTIVSKTPPGMMTSLQWGHGVEAVETATSLRSRGPDASFNGATA